MSLPPKGLRKGPARRPPRPSPRPHQGRGRNSWSEPGRIVTTMKPAHKSVLAAFLGAAALVCAAAMGGMGPKPKPKASPRRDPSLIAEFGGKKSATKGHRDSVMGFSLPTQIGEVLVKGGQEVTKGTLLIRGDDAEDLAVLKLQKLKADSDWPVQRAKKQADLAEVEYRRLEGVRKVDASSQQEVERAKLTWDVALIDHETAKVNQSQEVMQVDRLQARVDKLHLVAPFDGIVDNVMVDAGQNVNENEKV